MNSTVHIGTCAWSFDDWRGAFYPPSLPPNQWLAWYARFFSAVEIDSTFYATPGAPAVARWLAATPETFRFTCKMPREITHARKLRDCSEPLALFLAGIAPLRAGGRLGPVLIQLPPYFEPRLDEGALREFLSGLPRGWSFAVEFRHADWHQPRIVSLLENAGVCWVWNDLSSLAERDRAPFRILPQTSDCLYIRLIGDLQTKYRGDGSRAFRYSSLLWPRDSAIESWAVKIRRTLRGTKCVHIFANNHYEGFSPKTCQRLARQLGVEISLPDARELHTQARTSDPQMRLF